ncbi:hypothetical protein MKX01_028756, partial [Papaver californicum]
ARIECQSHRLTVEDPVTVEYITRYIAGLQQKYTQSGGVRPFGLSTLITDTSGIFSAWKDNATGRNSNSLREFLKKKKKTTKKLLDKKLGGKNIQIVVMGKDKVLRQLEESEIDIIVVEIEAEKAAAEAAKKPAPKNTTCIFSEPSYSVVSCKTFVSEANTTSRIYSLILLLDC